MAAAAAVAVAVAAAAVAVAAAAAVCYQLCHSCHETGWCGYVGTLKNSLKTCFVHNFNLN